MKMEDFYNPEVKMKYLATIEHPATKHLNNHVFKVAKDVELKLGKDIYQMNKAELGLVIQELECSTVESAYNHAFKLQYYIQWAASKEIGLIDDSHNPIAVIPDKKEWVKQYVLSDKISVFNRDDILKMINQMGNIPDQAILLCLFEGISGDAYSEILNLTVNDLSEKDGKFYAELRGNKPRKDPIEISEKLYDLLRATDGETVYYNKNGESMSLKSSESHFIPSPYIFKKAARGKKDGNLDAFFIQRKFQMFKTLFLNDNITPKQVINSGIMYMTHVLSQENNGVMTGELWEKVAAHFDAAWVTYKGKQYRNTFAIREKVNSELFYNKYGYYVTDELKKDRA